MKKQKIDKGFYTLQNKFEEKLSNVAADLWQTLWQQDCGRWTITAYGVNGIVFLTQNWHDGSGHHLYARAGGITWTETEKALKRIINDGHES